MADIPIEHELIKQAAALVDLKVIDTQIDRFMENTRVRITMQEDPEVLESCALGLIFTLGVLSFIDAKPRGVSADYADDVDKFRVSDLVRHLRFPKGRISFYADYVHGRMMKTSVEVSLDGEVVLETVNRGEAATRWVARLQGKKVVSLVGSQPTESIE
ncbi:MAG: hypothetical protein K2X36_01805 [Microbacteriaceae bacterium]|nr:hypothetical protein [Microbacteriaceae bacterium]